MAGKKDNSTILSKVALRRQALGCCGRAPVVLETHGGYGRIYERVYDQCRGVVIEKDAKKAEHLARQRPTWRVYQGCAETALAGGLARDIRFDLIDVDPYGSPFPAMDAIFGSDRVWGETLQLVVNDGLRQKVGLGGAWQVAALTGAVAKYGNDIYPVYAEVARELVEKRAAMAGYRVAGWVSRYVGHNHGMTHYWASLVQDGQ